MNEWIRTKNKLPNHGRDVEVIFVIDDFDPESALRKLQRRLIGIGNLDHSLGWTIRNGYIKNPFYHPPFDSHTKWDYVSHWRELDDKSSQILSKRGWDKEDFK